MRRAASAMPTRSSSAIASLRACERPMPRCSRSGSATWWPMVCTGFNAVIGSWNTMPMRLPRSAHSAASGWPSNSWPSKTMLPLTRALSGSSPSKAMAVSDLPLPDSPTRPSVSPAASEKPTSRTARAGPRWVCSSTDRSRTSSSGMPGPQRFLARRGSSRSRRPSPSRFSPSTAIAIATPGNTASRGAWNISVCASLSMRPHEGCGGCVPRPR